MSQIFSYLKLPKVEVVKLKQIANRAQTECSWVFLWLVCFPVTWWEEWKWRGSICSNYLAPHWQKSRESDPSARLCQDSHFSRLLWSCCPIVIFWCSLFDMLICSRFRSNFFFIKRVVFHFIWATFNYILTIDFRPGVPISRWRW